jgi:hypothetical protein
MRVRLTAGAIFIALLGVAAALAPPAAAESTPSAFGSRLVTLINQARAQHGLRALTVASGTSTVAANWTSHMASAQALSHNPNLASQLESHGSPNWTTYSENVAFGDQSSADAMFTNYMNSSEHRANILDSSFRYLGVGVVFSGGNAWNTLDFVDQYNSTSSSSSAPAPSHTTTSTKAPTASPKPLARARTAPRTTTTKILAKRPAQAARTAPRTSGRVTTLVQHGTAHVVAAKPHAVTPASTRTVRTVAPAAHPLAAPSPVALTAPSQNSGESHLLTLVAGLGIALVALVRVRIRRVLRAH